MIERLTDEQYADLGHRARVVRLEEIVSQAGICRLCGTHYSHDIEEPFANCGCHTTEWSGHLSPYQELEKRIHLAATVALPPMPMASILIDGQPYFTWTQMSLQADYVFKSVVEYLKVPKKALQVIPQPGERYKHHNGNEYEVIVVSNLDSRRPEYPVTVVYKGENGKVWSKPLADFKAKMSLVPTTGDQK